MRSTCNCAGTLIPLQKYYSIFPYRSDPDELFLLSCANTLKRLNSKQNAVARLKIQQALYESEFGTQGAADLPCVTPVSDYEASQ